MTLSSDSLIFNPSGYWPPHHPGEAAKPNPPPSGCCFSPPLLLRTQTHTILGSLRSAPPGEALPLKGAGGGFLLPAWETQLGSQMR